MALNRQTDRQCMQIKRFAVRFHCTTAHPGRAASASRSSFDAAAGSKNTRTLRPSCTRLAGKAVVTGPASACASNGALPSPTTHRQISLARITVPRPIVVAWVGTASIVPKWSFAYLLQRTSTMMSNKAHSATNSETSYWTLKLMLNFPEWYRSRFSSSIAGVNACELSDSAGS